MQADTDLAATDLKKLLVETAAEVGGGLTRRRGRFERNRFDEATGGYSSSFAAEVSQSRSTVAGDLKVSRSRSSLRSDSTLLLKTAGAT